MFNTYRAYLESEHMQRLVVLWFNRNLFNNLSTHNTISIQ